MSQRNFKKEYEKHNFTHFKNIKNPTLILSESTSIDSIDKQIRSRKMEVQIEKLRKETNKEKKERLKLLLTYVCFSGVFSKRSKKHLLQHSGLICLDIDKIPYAHELKDRLKEVDFIHYMFISPSGKGLKVIIKIDAKNEEEHLQYFLALELYFEEVLKVTIDTSCKDVSRACFLSYDSTAFYDIDSITLNSEWVKKHYSIEKVVPQNKKIEKVEIESEGDSTKSIIERGVDKFLNCEDGVKRITLYKICCYLGYHINAKKLEYTTCFNALKRAVEKREKETKDINSKKAAFKTIEDGLTYGLENPKPVDNLKTSKTKYQFWFAYDGSVTIRITSFYTFLNRNGFYGYTYDKSRKIVRVTDNVVSIVEKNDIIQFIMEHLRRLPYNVGNGCTKFDIMEKYQNMQSFLLGENQLQTFPILKRNFLEDDRTTAHLYYKNGVLQITKSGVNLIDYRNVKGLIWETSILSREWNLKLVDNSKYLQSDFVKFVRGVTGDRHDKKWSRYISMKSIIGYLIHEYKDPSRARAVVFVDEAISDNPEGGTGKSILMKALAYIKRTITIDGKNFNFKRSFAFQRVDIDTKLLVFEDVLESFDFERLFSVITDGITVERKGKQPFRIDEKDSPKILISTNYVVNGEGNSHNRRKVEIEFSQFYNEEHTPLDDLKKMLFEDWNEEDWMYFDLFIVECVNFYLNKGIIRPIIKNIPLRKLQQFTADEFAKYAQKELCKLEDGKEYNKHNLFKRFKQLYPSAEFDSPLTQTEFNKWLRKYASIMEYHIGDRMSDNKPLVKFTKKTPKSETL